MEKKKIYRRRVIALAILIAIIAGSIVLIVNSSKKTTEVNNDIGANTKKQYEFYLNNEIIENTENETKNILNNVNKEQAKNKNINLENFVKTLVTVESFDGKKVPDLNTKIDEEIQKYDSSTLEVFTKENVLNTVNDENIDKEVLSQIFEDHEFIKNLDAEKEKRVNYVSDLNKLKEELNYFNKNQKNIYLSENKYICKNDTMLNEFTKFTKKYNLEFQIEKEASTVSQTKANPGSGVPILCYHGILNQPWGIQELFVKVDEFEAQMKYLSEQGYTSLFVSELPSASNYEKPVIITFDDGYADVYTNAFPILKKYNMKANVYMISGWINGDVYMTTSMTQEMANSPLIEIGSHTVNHKALATLSEADIDYELRESKSKLEEMIGKSVDVIAYPTGSFDNRVINGSKKYYKYALSTINGKENPSNPNTYSLKRIYVYRKYNIDQFKNLF